MGGGGQIWHDRPFGQYFHHYCLSKCRLDRESEAAMLPATRTVLPFSSLGTGSLRSWSTEQTLLLNRKHLRSMQPWQGKR